MSSVRRHSVSGRSSVWRPFATRSPSSGRLFVDQVRGGVMEEEDLDSGPRLYTNSTSRRPLDGLGVEEVKQVGDCHGGECGFDRSYEAGSES